jgi:tetratricopeptide (TPR) repeat protein
MIFFFWSKGKATQQFKEGIVLLDQKKYWHAIQKFDETIKSMPKCAEAHYHMGISYLKLGKVSEAKIHFELANSLKPKKYSESSIDRTIDQAIKDSEEKIKDSMKMNHKKSLERLDNQLKTGLIKQEKYDKMVKKLTEQHEIEIGIKPRVKLKQPTKTRNCFHCGKALTGETGKILSKNPSNAKEIVVRSFCGYDCASTTVNNFIGNSTCVWCGKVFDIGDSVKGSYGEPYCTKDCWSEAGRAMFWFEFREGNM